MILLASISHGQLGCYRNHAGDRGHHPNLGRLVTPRCKGHVEETANEGYPWAADNDCFEGLDPVAYVRMLDRLEGLPGCLWVSCPDVVGDARSTRERFDEWAPELERRGLPIAYVAQDGIEDTDVPWDRIACLFIGGTNEFKLGPVGLQYAREATRRGKLVHWGRVNTPDRFDYIASTGAADSWDGSKWCRWRKVYLAQGLEWSRRGRAVPRRPRCQPRAATV